MTDKAQKIREEIERKLEVMQYQIHRKDAYKELKSVLNYMDSLQEEPVKKLWHRGDEFKDIEYQRICKKVIGNMENKRFVIGDVMEVENGAIDLLYEDGCVAMCIRKEDTWAYIDDIIKLSNVQRTIKDWKEEPVSEDLDKAAKNYAFTMSEEDEVSKYYAFLAGSKWQKKHLWKPADGDDLPEIDREVIAIIDYDFGHYKVVYAHRPNPNGWNGTNIDTGEKEYFEPVIYDKGGWNQPHVLYWLDTRLPYEEK